MFVFYIKKKKRVLISVLDKSFSHPLSHSFIEKCSFIQVDCDNDLCKERMLEGFLFHGDIIMP